MSIEAAAAQQAKTRKPTKNELKRAKKKQQKLELKIKEEESSKDAIDDTANANLTNGSIDASIDRANGSTDLSTSRKNDDLTTSNGYSETDAIDLAPDDPMYDMFSKVFQRFHIPEDTEKSTTAVTSKKGDVFFDDMDNIQDEDEERATMKRIAKMSKKKRKEQSKLSVAELKAIVRKPELVEWNDPDASDPQFLVSIKAARNVIPVPKHWSLKREYLSSKRGIQKPAYKLPQFIAETGISEMRDAVLEKQAQASLKSQQRARVQPKMGKLDLDYQKMYEAFFRRQTKPALTRYGEVYYEGKEYETNLRHLRPGELSDELKEALNMPPGAPPPWLINQQRIGPPPSYPALKIPGLNAPPPPGASWGFQAGGYGKPPVDADNKPLFGGDIFGLGDIERGNQFKEDDVDKSLWGMLPAFADEQEDEDEDEDDEEEEDAEQDDENDPDLPPGQKTGIETPFGGTATPGGFMSSVPTDLGRSAIAKDMNLRKERPGTETESSHHPRSAGTVLNERSIRAEGFFGGERAYDLGGGRQGAPPMLGSETSENRGTKRRMGDLDVSVDVDALERDDRLSKDQIKKQYEAQRSQAGSGGAWQGAAVDDDDLNQMIAEESSKRLRKDQDRQKARGGGGRR